MSDRKPIPGRGIELWIATIGIGAFLLGGLVDIDRGPPRIGTVRLDELASELVERTIEAEGSDRTIAHAARSWAIELERALNGVAQRHRVVLFPAEAVAAGATDYTDDVRAAMVGWETSYADKLEVDEHRGAQPEARP